jgi:hypothetical protein
MKKVSIQDACWYYLVLLKQRNKRVLPNEEVEVHRLRVRAPFVAIFLVLADFACSR